MAITFLAKKKKDDESFLVEPLQIFLHTLQLVSVEPVVMQTSVHYGFLPVHKACDLLVHLHGCGDVS